MAYAILRVAKHATAGTIKSIGDHNLRKRNTPNADESRTHQNIEIVGTGQYWDDVKKRIESVKREQEAKGSKLIAQKNSVKAIEHLLTASPEFFKEDTTAKIKRFTEVSVNFLNDTYGKDNVVSVSLHLDETTPHLTAMVTPIYESKLKGNHIVKRLGAKKWLDGRQKLSEMQDNFADRCKHLGLERGNKKSKAKHTTIKEFYSLINRADKNREVNFSFPKVEKPGAMELLQLTKWCDNQNHNIEQELVNSVNTIREALASKSFKNAAEILKEKYYQEDVNFKKQALAKLTEMKREIIDKEGEALKLKMQLQDKNSTAANTKEILRNVLENRYSKKEIKQIAQKFGARIIDKKGFTNDLGM